jgi:hypothetical protein
MIFINVVGVLNLRPFYLFVYYVVFLHSPVTSSLWGPNILLNAPFSNSLNLNLKQFVSLCIHGEYYEISCTEETYKVHQHVIFSILLTADTFWVHVFWLYRESECIQTNFVYLHKQFLLIDVCFYYQNKHVTLNPTHLFIFCNMFRQFVWAITRYSHSNINWNEYWGGDIQFTVRIWKNS